MSKSLYPVKVRHFIGPGLAQNVLQNLSEDDTSRVNQTEEAPANIIERVIMGFTE